MPCVKVHNGFVCSRGSVKTCDFPGCNKKMEFLCDKEVSFNGKTCDKHMCVNHAHEIKFNYHKCWLHMGDLDV